MPAKNSMKRKNGVRSDDEIEIVRYVRKHPGKTGEQIRLALTPPRSSRSDFDLGRLLRRLRAAGLLRGTGTTRAMTSTATATAK